MSVGSIYEEVIKTEAGRTMLQERVEACLDQLSATSSYLPAFVIEIDDSYVVGKLHPKSSQLILVFKLSFYFLLLFGFADFKSIISVAQKDEVCFIFSYFPEIFLKMKNEIFEMVSDGSSSYEKIWERSFQNVQILITGRAFC